MPNILRDLLKYDRLKLENINNIRSETKIGMRELVPLAIVNKFQLSKFYLILNIYTSSIRH